VVPPKMGWILAVGPGTAHRVLAHVAVAAVQLDAAVGNAVAQFGVPILDDGGLPGGQPANAVLGDSAVGELPRDRDLGQQEQVALKRPGGLAERGALLAIGQRVGERLLVPARSWGGRGSPAGCLRPPSSSYIHPYRAS